MRILFKDKSGIYPVLSCVDAFELGYDTDDGTMFFRSGHCTWFKPCSVFAYEELVQVAYNEGCLNLSQHVFELYDP